MRILQHGGAEITWNSTKLKAYVNKFHSTWAQSPSTIPGVDRRFTYDTFGRLLSETREYFISDPTTDTAGIFKKWQYEYDIAGNLAKVEESRCYLEGNSPVWLADRDFTTDREDWNQIQGTRRDFDAMGRATRTDFGETGSTPPVEFGVVYHPPQIVWGAEFGHMLSHGFTSAKWTESHDLYEGGQRRYYDFGSRLLARAIDRGYWSTEEPPPPGGGGEEEMMMSGGEGGEESMSGDGFEMNAGGGGTTHLYLWWEELRREHYAQLGWNDVAQWHVDEDAASSPFGLNRWLDWGIYHAGGLDSLLGSTRWVQSPAEQDDYAATEVFFVRDHLGSPALAMQAKRTLVSGETYRWELQPVESYEYAPYGDPTIHVPATDGSPQSAGRLALKEFESFAMAGAKSSDALLDRNDVGRPNGSTGNTWTRNGAVPVAKSFLGWSHLFTGRPWDADLRQYYIRHRWYEPLTGRWTAVDPIGYDGGINQYQYCWGDPLNLWDPLGLSGIGNWIRRNLPPIVGVPIGGAVDTVAGATKATAGAVTGDGSRVLRGLGEVGEGLLGTVGLPRDSFGPWEAAPTGGLPLPPSINREIEGTSSLSDFGPCFALSSASFAERCVR